MRDEVETTLTTYMRILVGRVSLMNSATLRIEGSVLKKNIQFFIIGHFTQVVWKSSTKMGVGKARSQGGWTYVVANYSPPGNYQGQFTANVLPPGNYFPEEAPKPTPPKKEHAKPAPQKEETKPAKEETESLSEDEVEEGSDDEHSEVHTETICITYDENSNEKLNGDLFTKFAKEVLTVHNEYRKMHGVPPLKLEMGVTNI